MCKLNE
jgi:hypothetical protein